MDLTQVDGLDSPVLGVIDAGTRACLYLRAIPDKTSLTILKILIELMSIYGIPKAIRTDNEAMFTSHIFNWVLNRIGVEHQRSQPGRPWQNGKIERLFGTLKSSAKGLILNEQDLTTFRLWYNHIRPHDYLDGRTPSEC